MASVLRRLMKIGKPKRLTKKNSITGRNHTFAVPYLSKLDGNQLQAGQSLIVRGVITGNEGFIINLTRGPRVELEEEGDEGELDDRLMALRVDILKKRVVMNACLEGNWGKEAFIKQQYKVGDEFDIRVRCFDQHFEIYVEHKLVAQFKHYVPMNNISHIYVTGDVRLYNVSWEGKLYTVPYTADIPGNFSVGRKLFVSAIADAKPQKFSIEFFAGEDVAFHLESSFINKKTYRKSQINKEWSPLDTSAEEISFPFKPKRSFDVLIYAADDCFVVYVNDIHYFTFNHRLPAESIDRLTVQGDVTLTGVHIK